MGATVEFRVRTVMWAATSAVLAIAATLIVTSVWSADAAPGDTDSTYVPTAGCRAFDYRPAPNQVGPRPTPLGAGEVETQQITGNVGECTGPLAIPADAVAVAMNVTAVNPTAQTNLRLFPANLNDVPLLSNLNVSAGQAPFPNKVDVALSPGGAIKIYNQNGSVSVLGDIVGYYTSSSLAEIDARLDALNSAIAANTAANAAQDTAIAGLVDGQPFAKQQRLGVASGIAGPTALVSLDLDAPVDGHYTLIATTKGIEGDTQVLGCSLSTQTDPAQYDGDYEWEWASSGTGLGARGTIAGTRVIAVAQGESLTVGYVCGNISGGESGFADTTLSAIFTPAP